MELRTDGNLALEIVPDEPVVPAPADSRSPVPYIAPGRASHTKGRTSRTWEERGPLMDPIRAYASEAQRMAMAGPRRRITADDLDKIRED